MQIEISNNTELSRKHVRLIRWKIHKLSRKFKQLLYINVFIKKEGRLYQSTVRLGIPGNDIILKHKHHEVYQLWKLSFDDGLRYMRKHKEKQLNY